MKAMRSRIFPFLIILITGLQSCADKFLELEPRINILEGNSYKTETDMFNAMVSVYKSHSASNGLENVPINVDIYSDDAYAAGEPTGGMWESWQPIEIGQPDPEQSSILLWQKFYRSVYLANLYLQKEELIQWSSEDKRNRMKAEVLTLRAYTYWNLVRFYGWVPVMTKIPDNIEGVKAIPQSPPEEVYRIVLKDLLEALPGLPETVALDEKGRITKDVVRVLIARIYLYYEGFAKPVLGITDEWSDGTTTINKAYVQNLMEEIINSGRYYLLENYADVFDWGNENNDESIFEWQYSDQGISSYADGSLSRDGNFSCHIIGIRNPLDPRTVSGWSFATVSFSQVREFEAGDTRLGVSVYNNEDSIGKGAHGPQFQYTGYFNAKYLPNASYRPSGSVDLNWPINYKDMRYAEVLLIAAELFMNDDQQKAVGYLNQVRTRAMGEEAALQAADLNIDAIYHERRVEFGGEGQRYWDLLRRGLAYAQEKIDYSWDTTTFPDYVAKSDFLGRQFNSQTWGMLPIPATEIRAMNEGVLKQYVPAYK
jgi:starch-binding outer membrane protein, SusD/RagB family